MTGEWLQGVPLGIAGDHQVQNAALALALVECFMHKQGLSYEPAKAVVGARECSWPGRSQVLAFDGLID